MKSTDAMRQRVRELAMPIRDDYDRAVLAVLDDFETITRLPPDEDISDDAAMAYATGYVAGLDAAQNQEAATLVKERDTLSAQCAFERALRNVMERRNSDLIGRIAELEAAIVALRQG